jgi:hypothetical protein
MKYKVGDCIVFDDGLYGLITKILDREKYPNCMYIGCEKYYPDGFHLAGWDWYKEENIIGLVDEQKREEMVLDYKKQKEECLKKGYPNERFIEV